MLSTEPARIDRRNQLVQQWQLVGLNDDIAGTRLLANATPPRPMVDRH